VNDCVDEMKL